MQNILITGGGSGIGRVTARLFLERGWRVGLIGRRQDALEETAAKNPNALVLSCDVTDPQAVDAAKANAERNGVSAHFADSREPIDGQFDILIANILANPLKALAPALAAHVRPGGWLALSGILAEQEEELMAIYSPWFAMAVADRREGWVCLEGRRI